MKVVIFQKMKPPMNADRIEILIRVHRRLSAVKFFPNVSVECSYTDWTLSPKGWGHFVPEFNRGPRKTLKTRPNPSGR
jgi:hypothetical protein